MSEHQKQSLTASGEVFFQRIFPKHRVQKWVSTYKTDIGSKKLFLRLFVIFLVCVIMCQPGQTSLRDLEAASQDALYQRITQLPNVSHNAFSERLKAIPAECMNEFLTSVQHDYKSRLHFKSPALANMQVFDVTSFSVSAAHYQWAANLGSRNMIRMLFVMDSYSGTPDAIIDASRSTNDNAVFGDAIKVARPGATLVFDRGFCHFKTFAKILSSGRHFITRWKTNYVMELVTERKVEAESTLERGWFIIKDEIVLLGHPLHQKRLTVRKITCGNHHTHEEFIIMTDHRNLSAKQVVRMYVLRWPIEVFFRHLKSTLRVIRFPSRDPQGVHNWLVLVCLSVLCLELITLPKTQDATCSLMVRHSPFKARLRYAQRLLHHWALHPFHEELH